MIAKRNKKQVTLPDKFEPRFWDSADGRCSIIKEIRRRYLTLKEDTQSNSYQKDLLCQRAIFISVQLETMERVAAEKGKFNAGVYTQMVNALVGLLKSLGLERRAKKVVNLKTYIKERKNAHRTSCQG
jgi:hypothetical protein